jgi:hypothetical protein
MTARIREEDRQTDMKNKREEEMNCLKDAEGERKR